MEDERQEDEDKQALSFPLTKQRPVDMVVMNTSPSCRIIFFLVRGFWEGCDGGGDYSFCTFTEDHLSLYVLRPVYEQA